MHPPPPRYVMLTLTNGLVSLDVAISTLCCNALDSIATACHQNRTRTKPDPELLHLIQLMDHCGAVFLKVGGAARRG